MIDWMTELAGRIRSFFRKQQREDDFQAELAMHLDLLIEDNIRQGMSPAEARRRALMSLGGLEQAKELHRENRGLPLLDSLLRDFQYARRILRREASFSAFAILIIGLGVGASATVFNVFHTLLYRPLPFAEPNQLVWIGNGESENLSDQTIQVGNMLDLRSQTQSFAEIVAFSPFYGAGDIQLTGTGEPERLTGIPVTQNFFELLGVRPYIGRFFSTDECKFNGPKAAILTNDFWRRRFSSNPDIIGRTITLDNAPVTIVGVLPASFDFASTFAPGSRSDLFSPFPLSMETDRRGNALALIGRLKPAVNLQSAQSETAVISQRIAATPHDSRRNWFNPKLSKLQERISGKYRRALVIVFAAVGFLLLLVCANLSNLLLARASVRAKEMAVRAALGANRWRLIQQTLIESVLLSTCGAALGLALSYGGVSLLARLQNTTIPLLRDVRVDGVSLAFTIAAAILTGLLFGLIPAIQMSPQSPVAAMNDGARGSTGGRELGWIRNSVVVCEVSLACVLLTGAGLLLHSLIRVLNVNLGFETRNMLALRIDPGRRRPTLESKTSYFDEVLRSIRSTPGVEAAGLTDALPLGQNFGWRLWSVEAKGQAYESGHYPRALVRMIDDGYFEAMRIRVNPGRSFTMNDTPSTEQVAIISEPLARRLWPDRDAVGQYIKTAVGLHRVVGVVPEVHYFGFEQKSGPEMYFPIRQMNDAISLDLVIRGTGSEAELAPRIRAALKAVDPNIPATEFHTMQGLADRSTFARRAVATLVGGFAAFALILALLGIYAVISYSVSQRKQEIGIRMALGASAGDLQSSILRQTGRLAILGMAIGLPASWIAARGIQALLFDVKSGDPPTFAAVICVMSVVALLAGYLPARKASRLNPVEAIRAD